MNQPSTFLLPPNVRRHPSAVGVPLAADDKLAKARELTCESLGDECTDAESSDNRAFLRDGELVGEFVGDQPTFGKFLVLRTLGRGGQATALLAFDPDLRRRVVLKVYHSAKTEAQRAAVLQEGQALAQVDSPYVAKCFGAERRDGVPYLIIEYVAGATLAEVNQKRRLSVVEAIELLEQVAQGVEAIHAQGLLHRDLKPSNILIAADGTPRLVDFGLAAAIGSEKLRQISGTPAYMAPEQAAGDLERMDERTDIFGLGAVFYELLTGRPPYLGESVASVWSQAKVGDVLPAIERARDLKQAVSDVCMRCLAKEPARRFESTRSLRAALDDLRLGRRRHWNLSLGLGKYRVRLAFGVSVALLLVVTGLGWMSGGLQVAQRELALREQLGLREQLALREQAPRELARQRVLGGERDTGGAVMSAVVDSPPTPPPPAMRFHGAMSGPGLEQLQAKCVPIAGQVPAGRALEGVEPGELAQDKLSERVAAVNRAMRKEALAERPSRATIWESGADGWFAIWGSDGQGYVARLWPVSGAAQVWLQAGDRFVVDSGAGIASARRAEVRAGGGGGEERVERLYLLTAQDETAIDDYLPIETHEEREGRTVVAEQLWQRGLEVWSSAPGRKVQVVENDASVGNLTP